MTKRITLTIKPEHHEWLLQRNKKRLNMSAFFQAAIWFAVTCEGHKKAKDLITRLRLEKKGQPFTRGMEDGMNDAFNTIKIEEFSRINKGDIQDTSINNRLTPTTNQEEEAWNRYYAMGWKFGVQTVWDEISGQI